MTRIMKIDEMAGQQRINNKPVITFEEAEKMLFDKLNELELGDDVYDVVTNIFHRFINEIEDEYTIVDADGEVYNSSTNNAGEAWYDESEENFRDECYGKIKSYL